MNGLLKFYSRCKENKFAKWITCDVEGDVTIHEFQPYLDRYGYWISDGLTEIIGFIPIHIDDVEDSSYEIEYVIEQAESEMEDE